MGHLFAVGGRTSESEQSIYVGNLGDIGAEDFPAISYVALGHLHRSQCVGGKAHPVFRFAIYAEFLSEVGQDKNYPDRNR